MCNGQCKTPTVHHCKCTSTVTFSYLQYWQCEVSNDKTEQYIQTQLSADIKAWSACRRTTEEGMASDLKQSASRTSLNRLVVNVLHSCRYSEALPNPNQSCRQTYCFHVLRRYHRLMPVRSRQKALRASTTKIMIECRPHKLATRPVMQEHVCHTNVQVGGVRVTIIERPLIIHGV